MTNQGRTDSPVSIRFCSQRTSLRIPMVMVVCPPSSSWRCTPGNRWLEGQRANWAVFFWVEQIWLLEWSLSCFFLFRWVVCFYVVSSSLHPLTLLHLLGKPHGFLIIQVVFQLLVPFTSNPWHKVNLWFRSTKPGQLWWVVFLKKHEDHQDWGFSASPRWIVNDSVWWKLWRPLRVTSLEKCGTFIKGKPGNPPKHGLILAWYIVITCHETMKPNRATGTAASSFMLPLQGATSLLMMRSGWPRWSLPKEFLQIFLVLDGELTFWSWKVGVG